MLIPQQEHLLMAWLVVRTFSFDWIRNWLTLSWCLPEFWLWQQWEYSWYIYLAHLLTTTEVLRTHQG